MDTINELAADERTARIILAVASEPGDAVTGRMIRTVGASETIARVLADEVPPRPDGDTWQRRLAPRIDLAQTRRVLAETERPGMRVLIPGDAEWPAGVDALGDGAPVALWAKGDIGLLSRPVWDRLTVTGARASTAYGEHVTTELVQSAVADSRVVFSGGAYGIDGAAHRAALASDGSTVAVLAGGLDRPYPWGMLISLLVSARTGCCSRNCRRVRLRRSGGSCNAAGFSPRSPGASSSRKPATVPAPSTPPPVHQSSAVRSVRFPGRSRAPRPRGVIGCCVTGSPRW